MLAVKSKLLHDCLYIANRQGCRSGRQGYNLAGESPAMTIVRFRSYSDATAQGR